MAGVGIIQKTVGLAEKKSGNDSQREKPLEKIGCTAKREARQGEGTELSLRKGLKIQGVRLLK